VSMTTQAQKPRVKSPVPKDGDRLLGTHVAAKTKHHHLDKRANDLAEQGASAGYEHDLLTTQELAAWFGVSVQWAELCRVRDNGSTIRQGRQAGPLST
jgi:hypothetical protein